MDILVPHQSKPNKELIRQFDTASRRASMLHASRVCVYFRANTSLFSTVLRELMPVFLPTKLQCQRIVAGSVFFVRFHFAKCCQTNATNENRHLHLCFLPCHLLLNYSFQFCSQTRCFCCCLNIQFRWCILKVRAGLLLCVLIFLLDLVCVFCRFVVTFWAVCNWRYDYYYYDLSINEKKNEIKASCAAN